MASREHLERVSKALIGEGKLIEAGWAGLRLAVGLENAPAEQLREMRTAFFAGAQHLLASVMSVLDPGAEPTDADLKLVGQINNELQKFIEGFAQDVGRKNKASARPAPAEPARPTAFQQTLGDAPIEADYREQMNVLAHVLDAEFNGGDTGRKTGFVLLVFPFADHAGRCNYISNANRDDVVVLLKEQLARFEGWPDASGHA
jgi:hypothetical protein